MKKLLFLLLLFPGMLLAQTGSVNTTALHSKVVDSTSVIKPSGYGTLYYNSQSNKWKIVENGVTRDLLRLMGDVYVTSGGASTVIALKNKLLPSLSTGFLKYNGSAWTFDASTYITTISGITAGGDLSGTYPNPIVAKVNGNTIPANAAGSLTNNGSGTLSWVVNLTNTAANNELIKSNGTNGVPSGLFSTSLGDLNFGTGLSGAQRTLSADGSASNIALALNAKGSGTSSLSSTGTVNILGTSQVLFNTGSGLTSGFTMTGDGTNDIVTGNAIGAGTTTVTTKSPGVSSSNSSTLILTTGSSGTSGNTNSGDVRIFTGPKNASGTPGMVSIEGMLRYPHVSTSFSTNQNNYSVGTGTYIEMSTDDTVTRQLTGISGGGDGRLLIIRNMNGTAVIAFNNEDSGSTTTNRFHTSTGATLNLNPAKVLMLLYDASLSRWIDISF